ncbi:MAG: hypothetical protein U5K74_15700 [Gemmatimonadaceae bacterium]|nr:hypothetical protein [Gemmatimonadaceae bacterium]
MPINFIPNDPTVVASLPIRSKTPRAERPTTRAGFRYVEHNPARRYAPGSPDFLFWQTREAALATMQLWERLHAPLTAWARSTNRRLLDLIPDSADEDLNAYYDGQSLAFFHYRLGSRTFFSGASTEVVAHEVGHALLDSIRPDLWSSLLPETGAFHEAFGDCIAILNSFADAETVALVLRRSGGLSAQNVAETFGEDLAKAVKQALGSSHPASKPRQALNTFQWQLPSDLPRTGGPDVLTSEVHSFARVFTGIFYDLIRNLLGRARTAAAVRKATTTAGRLLIAGTIGAPLTARFFQAVGRVMMLEDRNVNGGANDRAIADAFAAHGIMLGSSAMLQPVSALEPTTTRAATARSTRTAMTALGRRLGGADGRELGATRRIEIGGTTVMEVSGERRVPLSGISERLSGVVAYVPNSVLVGDMTGSGRSAVLGGFSDPASVDDEVRRFVAMLMERGRIDFSGDDRLVAAPPRAGARKAGAARGATAARDGDRRARLATHLVVDSAGARVLERARFACGPPCCGADVR